MSLLFQTSDVKVHRIIESETAFLPVRELFPDLSDELLDSARDWLISINALDAKDRTLMCFQSFLLETPHHNILIDTCIGNHKPRPRAEWNMRNDSAYMRALDAAGFHTSDIDYVMCTHLHVDHVGWNTQLENNRWVPTFPNARYIFGEREHAFWAAQHVKRENAVYADSVLPVIEAGRADLVQDNYTIGDHIRLISTPGHTTGHVSIGFGNARDEGVITGDALHSPLQLLDPDLSMIYDNDGALAAQSRGSLLEHICGNEAFCCGSHFPSPSIGKLIPSGKGFICDAFPGAPDGRI